MAGAQGRVGVVPGLHAVAAGLFGGITGGVGGLQDGRRGGPACIHRHQADAGAHPQALAVVHEAVALHAVTHPLRGALGLVRPAVRQDDGKFIAPQAGQGVAVAHRVGQQLGHLLQQLVAGAVAAGIVDQFELVQIDVEPGVLAAVGARGLQQALQPGLELRAVDQPGQRVVAGAVAHLTGLLGQRPGGLGQGRVGALQVQQARSRLAQAGQQLALLFAHLASLAVDHAQGAHPVPIGQAQRHAGVEADARQAGDQGVVGEAAVQAGVRHFQQGIRADRVVAKSPVPGGFAPTPTGR